MNIMFSQLCVEMIIILLHVKILLTLAFTENAEKTKTIDFKRSYLGGINIIVMYTLSFHKEIF